MSTQKIQKTIFILFFMFIAMCFHTSTAGAIDVTQVFELNSTSSVYVTRNQSLECEFTTPYDNMIIKINVSSVNFPRYNKESGGPDPQYALSFPDSYSFGDRLTGDYENTYPIKRVGKHVIKFRVFSDDMISNVTITDVSPYATSVSAKDITVNVGKTADIKASVSPDNVLKDTFIYRSADPSIAKVDELGTVTGKAIGKTTINIKEPLSGVSKDINVNVEPVHLSIKGSSKIKLAIGKTYKTKVKSDYKNPFVYYSSSNSKIASVDSSGKIKAKNLGVATITAKTKGGNSVKWKVTVNETYIDIVGGSSKKYNSILKYVKNQGKGKWETSNKNVAQVSGKTIKGISSGKADVTLTANGVKYTITTYVADKTKLKNAAVSTLKSILRNPSSLIINNAYYDKDTYVINYSAMNGFGGYSRDNFIAWYEKGKLDFLS